ncbi:ubiquinol-cytochrome c reductase iron-sulfur subunit [uncultured Maribacter sp.]|uniref:QcrA and Rieske domain-containing protein n=1 Tax=uncultured Maribacter sp. TaxID=431308 RepID=UPI00261EF9F6|nr:Rieske 2Fe-2S domain-containing protein [uncultured Maribacter sp.]
MKRKEFLRSVGASAAFAVLYPCLGSCSKDDATNGAIVKEPEEVNFTVDLNSSEGQKLNENGSFILKNYVVVAKNLEGEYVAASQVCSHQQYDQVRFVPIEGGIFHCDVHGSKFAQDGSPLNQVQGDPARPIKIYNIQREGDILTITA